MPQYIEKDPNAIRDIGVDVRNILPAGVTVSDVTVTAPLSSGLTVVSDFVSGTIGKARLSGGTSGVKNARVVFHFTFSNGEEDDRSMYVTIRDK